MAEASRDQNFVTSLLAVSNVDGMTPVTLYADPVTHRLLVDIAVGSGTVTSVSVVTANGFAGSVATATTTPAITISTTITGILQGNGTAISAITVGTGLDFTGGTLSATNAGAVTSVSGTANRITSTGGQTPVIDISAAYIGQTSITTLGTIGTGTWAAGTVGPATNDGFALGSATVSWADLFLASGALINYANGNVILTHSSGILTMGTGELRVTTAGTNTASVITQGSTNTLANKTLSGSNGNVLGAVTMTLGSDADGDTYYRSSNVLTRLAKGTALQVLRMNAGATAPEWATAASGSITIGTTTITSGTTTRILYDNAGVVGEYTISGSGTVVAMATSPVLATPTLNTPTITAWDGWNTVTDSWTYASATTITVPSGAASLYSVGDKIKINQSGLKYFSITTVADTLLTVTAGSDYTVANAAISGQAVSHVERPVGFPSYFNYTPTGVSATNVTLSAQFWIIGRRLFLDFKAAFTGGITFTTMPTLPVAVSSSFLVGGGTASSPMGVAGYLDSGTSNNPVGLSPCAFSSDTTMTLATQAGANMSASVPITWANGDTITARINYLI